MDPLTVDRQTNDTQWRTGMPAHEPSPAPVVERSLVEEGGPTTSWSVAVERLANPETPRTSWLATVMPDGRPHLMPIIAFWFDGALHFVAGEQTRKGRNLSADARCSVGLSSTRLPSIDIIVEGRAAPLDDAAEVERVAARLRSNEWPLEARGVEVYGPNAPTAGEPPYRIWRLVPTKVTGLPGMFGMERFQPDELPKPTRWEFAVDRALSWAPSDR
jgi:hypothetical protein